MKYQYKVLISAPYFIPFVERYRKIFDENHIEILIPKVSERLGEDELLGLLENIDGTICGDDHYTQKVFQIASKLKVISKWGTGIDSIDLVAAKKNHVQVKNTPNAFTEPVSDTVMGYILSFARNLFKMNEDCKNGHWEKVMGSTLAECTVGVIGVGNIGKAVARKLKAFHTDIIGYDINGIDADFLSESGMREVKFDDLLRESDFITLNCDLNPSSYHLINKDSFLLMKKNVVLVNTSRGPVVNNDDLVEALLNKKIRGAALDVFEIEPLPINHPFRKISNCFCAPHNSNSSPAAWNKVHENSVQNLLSGLKNG